LPEARAGGVPVVPRVEHHGRTTRNLGRGHSHPGGRGAFAAGEPLRVPGPVAGVPAREYQWNRKPE